MLKIKKLNRYALLPVKKPGDAAYDLYSYETVDIAPGRRELVGTGIACEFPSKYVGRIVDRSGVAVKKGLHVIAGVIDASYRGEWKIALYNTTGESVTVGAQTRIAQVLFYEVGDFPIIEVDELSKTSRGASGFGSSGRD
jgi:dUTP pyrophosphatase